MMKQKLTYCIAGHLVEIQSDFPDKLQKMLVGFIPFFVGDMDIVTSAPILHYLIGEAQNKIGTSFSYAESVILQSFDIEQGKCTLRKEGLKYIFTVEDLPKDGLAIAEIKPVSLTLLMETGSQIVRCLYDTRKPINPNHLKFSLWMAMAFVGIPRQTVALHSSVIISENQAILFLGESGTGKSTHTKLWLDHIPGSSLLNDDSPLVRIEPDKTNGYMPFVYGSPWSGKGQCYRNKRYPVAAFVRLQQHKSNYINYLSKLEAFGALYPSFPPAFVKDDYFDEQICSIISAIIKTIPVYRLQCLPASAAAELVRNIVFTRHP